MAAPKVEIDKTDGNLAPLVAGNDDLCVVMGCCHDGPELVLTPVTDIGRLAEVFKAGPAVAATAYHLIESGKTIYLLRLPSTTEGTMEDMAITGAGTAAIYREGTPNDSMRIVFEVVKGGVLGTPGVKVRVSFDAEASWYGPRALGSAVEWELEDKSPSGITLVFGPPEAEVIALAAEIHEQLTDHMDNTGGTFHTNPDTVNTFAMGVPATYADAKIVINAARGIFEAHRVLTAGTVHSAADTTNIVTLPVATTPWEYKALGNMIKAKFNLHRLQSGKHAANDTVNVIAGDDITGGTIPTGLKIKFDTVEPKWAASDLTDGYAKLDQTLKEWAFTHVTGVTSLSEATTMDQALQGLVGKNRFVWGLANVRWLEPGETEEDDETIEEWAADLTNTWGSFTSEDGVLWMCAGVCYLPNPINGRIEIRPFSYPVAARAAENDVSIDLIRDTGDADLLPLAGASIVDSNNDPVFYDERVHASLSDERFIVPTTIIGRLGVYVADPITMAPTGSDYKLGQVVRVINVACRVVYQACLKELKKGLLGEPTTGFIRESDAENIDDSANNALTTALISSSPPRVSSALFRLKRDEVITNVNQAVVISGDLDVQPKGYPSKIKVRVRVVAKQAST